MRTALLHTAALAPLVTSAALAATNPAETTDEPKSETACLITRAYDDLRESVSGAIDQARDSAHRRYIIDRYVPDPSSPVELAAKRDQREMWRPLEPGSALPEHAVLLIHGLDEPGTIWSDAAPRIRREGFELLRYRYPNDDRITPSAVHLSSLLLELRARGLRCVDLVAHSMGGLVALELLTREGLYGGNAYGHDELPDARRLITVGTPFHGSPLAPMRWVTEIREQASTIFAGDGPLADRALRFLHDGTGEAANDLKPDSEFLNALHARPLPTGVRITTIAGRLETRSTKSRRESALTDGFVPFLIGEKNAKDLLRATDGLSRTIGDGVVPVASARLEGVQDAVTHRADHRSLIKRFDGPGLVGRFVRGLIGAPDEPPAIDTIIERLRERCGCDAPD